MTVSELNREQIMQLKCNYLDQLSGEGCIDYVLYGDEEQRECGVYMGEYAIADELIPDDVLFRHCEGFDFSEDDFTC